MAKRTPLDDAVLRERFWQRVDLRGPDDCWPWLTCLTVNGYGDFSYGSQPHRFRTVAHRVAYELTIGPIPDGLLACHRCDNRVCCNPAHIFLGTNADNTADMMAKGRHRWGGPRFGERNWNAKLSDMQRAEIVETFQRDGVTKSHLARCYGVTVTRICQIVLHEEGR